MDIGTNGEIMLSKEREYLACSAVPGPAFEGAQMSCRNEGSFRSDCLCIPGGRKNVNIQ